MTNHHSQRIRLDESAFASTRRERHRQARSCPPHAWECPVLTKLDPLAIAWTCAGCGAIVNAPVGAPRPQSDAVAVGA
jgi:hypothetical protein